MPVIFQFNPRALSTHLDYALQRTEQLVRIGLNIPEPDLTTLIIPGKHFGFGFDTFPVWRPPLAKREFSTWVLTNGFCDIAEAITRSSSFLFLTLHQGKGGSCVDRSSSR
jgi:hypothetical protein